MDLFAERTADYRAVVERVPESGLAAVVARVPGRRRARSVRRAGRAAARMAGRAVPAIELARDTPPLPAAELDRMAGVVTGCAVAIAETGTIILDHGPGQGRRALTLVPDFHLVIVRASQVYADLADAFARLDRPAAHPHLRPLGHQRHRADPGRGRARPRNLHVLLALRHELGAIMAMA